MTARLWLVVGASAGIGLAGVSCGGGGNGSGTTGGTGGEPATASGGATASGTGGASGATGGRNGSGGASIGNGAGGAPGAGGSAPMGLPASDGFDGTTLDPSWTVLRPDLAQIAVAGGSLSITPRPYALWYQSNQGELVYKLVTGDFKATATVHARKASNPSATPDQYADVGGLMARGPGTTSENYVLGVVGWAEQNQLAIEHKSTTNGGSVYAEMKWPTGDAELRLCRTGSTFAMFVRNPGDAAWGAAFYQIARADLPATVQVGPIAYNDAAAPDFVAIFDAFTFEAVGAGCAQ